MWDICDMWHFICDDGCWIVYVSCVMLWLCQGTAVLKGKGVQWQEIERFARLYATYFYLDPLVL